MAEKLGITQQSYAQMESNLRSTSVERLYTIMRLINVQLSFLPSNPVTEEVSGAQTRTGPTVAFRPQESKPKRHGDRKISSAQPSEPTSKHASDSPPTKTISRPSKLDQTDLKTRREINSTSQGQTFSPMKAAAHRGSVPKAKANKTTSGKVAPPKAIKQSDTTKW